MSRDRGKVRNRDVNLPQMPKPSLAPQSRPSRGRGRSLTGIAGRSSAPRSRIPTNRNNNPWHGQEQPARQARPQPDRPAPTRKPPPDTSQSSHRTPEPELINDSTPPQNDADASIGAPSLPTETKSESQSQSVSQSKWEHYDDESDDDFFQTKLEPSSITSAPQKNSRNKPPPAQSQRPRKQPQPPRGDGNMRDRFGTGRVSNRRDQSRGRGRGRGRGRPAEPASNPWVTSKPRGNVPSSNFFNNSDRPQQTDEVEEDMTPAAHANGDGMVDVPPVVREYLQPGSKRGKPSRRREPYEDDMNYERRDEEVDLYGDRSEPPRQQKVRVRRSPHRDDDGERNDTRHRRPTHKPGKRHVERRFASSPCDVQPPKLTPFRRELYRRRLIEVQERNARATSRDQQIAERREYLAAERKRLWVEKLRQTLAPLDMRMNLPGGMLGQQSPSIPRPGRLPSHDSPQHMMRPPPVRRDDESFPEMPNGMQMLMSMQSSGQPTTETSYTDDMKDWPGKPVGEPSWGFEQIAQTAPQQLPGVFSQATMGTQQLQAQPQQGQLSGAGTTPNLSTAGTPQQQVMSGLGQLPQISLGGTNPNATAFTPTYGQPTAFGQEMATTGLVHAHAQQAQMAQPQQQAPGGYYQQQMWPYGDQMQQHVAAGSGGQQPGQSQLSVQAQSFQPQYSAYSTNPMGVPATYGAYSYDAQQGQVPQPGYMYDQRAYGYAPQPHAQPVQQMTQHFQSLQQQQQQQQRQNQGYRY